MSDHLSRVYDNRPLSVLVWIRLIRVVQQITRNAQSALDEVGLTGPQFDMLVHIQAAPGVTQKELTQRLKVTKGNISQLLEKLEQKGLLTRHREWRKSQIVLTKAGEQLVEQMRPEHDEFIHNQFAALTPAEQRQLLGFLDKLVKK
ncbi:MAG: MarR family transcriptional regulator [Chloroflexota bacterium]